MPFLNFSLLINEIELVIYSSMKRSLPKLVGRMPLQNWTTHWAQAGHLTATESRTGDEDERNVS